MTDVALPAAVPSTRDRARGLVAAFRPRLEQLAEHPVHDAVDGPAALARFAELHVFAVWDFMQLLKSLQSAYAGQELPWTPPRNRAVARFVNELVLGEESDVDPRGGWISHFELYREGMREIGASTAGIDALTQGFANGHSVNEALRDPAVPDAARAFVARTLRVAYGRSLPALAGVFCLGRECVLPLLFERLLDGAAEAPLLKHYFERHVELDGGVHGELASELLVEACGDSPLDLQAAETAAAEALDGRAALWDAALAHLARD